MQVSVLVYRRCVLKNLRTFLYTFIFNMRIYVCSSRQRLPENHSLRIFDFVLIEKCFLPWSMNGEKDCFLGKCVRIIIITFFVKVQFIYASIILFRFPGAIRIYYCGTVRKFCLRTVYVLLRNIFSITKYMQVSTF